MLDGCFPHLKQGYPFIIFAQILTTLIKVISPRGKTLSSNEPPFSRVRMLEWNEVDEERIDEHVGVQLDKELGMKMLKKKMMNWVMMTVNAVVFLLG